MSQSQDLLALYRARCQGGLMRDDPHQRACLAALQPFQDALSRHGFQRGLQRVWSGLTRQQPLRGVYVHGGVGTGKTMLMDLFFSASPEPKRRLHHHVLKAAWVEALHAEHPRSSCPSSSVAPPSREHAPASFAELAKNYAGALRLLCWDEVELVDIADAMMFSRFLHALARYPMTLILTSNRPPEALYQGLHAEMFQPTVRWLRTHFLCHTLDGGQDYRVQAAPGTSTKPTAFRNRYSMQDTDQALMRSHFAQLSHPFSPTPQAYPLMGRWLKLRCVAGGIAWASFHELCEHPLSPQDYRCLGEHVHTVFLNDVPDLAACARDPIRRFIGLVDTLYDLKIPLVLGLQAPLENPGGTWAFAADRTLSRLHEMNHWPATLP